MVDKDLSSLCVMAVDDEAFAQRFLLRVLKTLGIEQVIACDNGAAALDALAETDSTVDLIFCDIEMPEMDGYEFVRKLRYGTVPQYKDAPVLMLTGNDTPKNVQRGQMHRIDGFIVKPPKADTLKPEIVRVLGLE